MSKGATDKKFNIKLLGEKLKVTKDDHSIAKAIVVASAAKKEYSYQYLIDDKKWVRINNYPQLVGEIFGIYEINNKVYVVDKKGISTLDNEFYKLPLDLRNIFCATCQAKNNILVYRDTYSDPFCKLLDTKNKKVVDFSFQTTRKPENSYFAVVHYLNQFWIIGGIEYYGNEYGGFKPVNKIQIYDPVSKTTSLSPVKMIQARIGHSVIGYNDKLFVFGGCSGETILNTVEMYSPETNKFTMMASMKHARSNFAWCRVENLVYVIGGTRAFPKSMEIYNLDTNVWTDGVDSPVFKSNLYACAVNNYIF